MKKVDISDAVSSQHTGNSLRKLMEFLLPGLAPVLIGVKPSVLRNVCNCWKAGRSNYYTLWEKSRKEVACTTNLDFIELREKRKGRGVQVLFFDPNLLFSTLIQHEHKSYLAKFGYASCHTLPDYLDLLKKRFQSPEFPHEIGIFLGYPLKDVCGFIEKKDKPCPMKGTWRVFGDPQESLRIMNRHRQAKNIFSILLAAGQNPLSCLDEIRKEILNLEGSRIKVMSVR